MLKVNNKKAVRNLAKKSFLANKSRNIVAVMAIALTAVLFTTLFTMGLGTMETFQNQTIRQAGGDGHAALKYIDDEIYNNVKTHPLIREISYNRLIADDVINPEFLKRRAELWYMDDVGLKLANITLADGQKPQGENEIITDTRTLDLLGLPKKLGTPVSIRYTQGGVERQADFILSGYWESDPVFNVGQILVSDAFVKAHEAELANAATSGDGAGTVMAYIMFDNTFNLVGKLATVLQDNGYRWEETGEDAQGSVEGEPISANVNWAYLSSNFTGDPVTATALIAGVLLMGLTGYLIIYNIFQISVIKEIRFYGLLKTIGTTRKQIKALIRYQALLLSAIGIPIGLVLGFLAGKALVPAIVATTSYASGGTTVSLNPVIFIGSAIFALLTVLVSTQKPGKIAAGISPVEAVRYTEGAGTGKNQKKRLKKSTAGGKLSKMAFSNVGRNKKKAFLVIVSLSLSLVLFNSAVTLSRGLDMDSYLSKFVGTDFLIASAGYFNYEYPEEGVTVSDSFIESVGAQPGFLEGGRLYCQKRHPALTTVEMKELPAVNVAFDGNAWADIYGMEDLPLSRLEVVEGEIDYEKLKTGKYILEGISLDDNNKPKLSESKYDIGEKVAVRVYDINAHTGEELTALGTAAAEKTMEVEIMAKVAYKYYTDTSRVFMGKIFYLPANVYAALYEEPLTMSYAFNVEDGAEQEMGAFVKKYTQMVEPTMEYEDKQIWIDEYNQLIATVLLVGGVLSFIIGLVGILNFVNAIATSIVTRRREFAMLQAIGMTLGQLKKMLCLEGLYYAAGTIAFSAVLSAVFSVTALKSILSIFFFFKYSFTLWPLVSVYPVLLILAVVIPYLACRGIVKETVVERLRETA